MYPENKAPEILNALGLRKYLKRKSNEHKGDAGKVLLIGGASGMAGALVLAGRAALYTGAGWTVLKILDSASAKVVMDQAELMVTTSDNINTIADQLKAINPDVIAIGPGLGLSALAKNWLSSAINYKPPNYSNQQQPGNIPLIVDADALNIIASDDILLEKLISRNKKYNSLCVLTPHPGEAARLLGISSNLVQENRKGALGNLIRKTGSIIVLKGEHSLIASPDHPPLICMRGNPGMGTGGMGDILTGAIAAIASQGIRHNLNLWQSACLSVELHSAAADILVSRQVGPIGLTPSETILEMRELINKHQ